MKSNHYPDNLGQPLLPKSFPQDTIVGGIDEAGRGSVLGPLVVAGVSIRQKNLAGLRRAGVRDSKLLSTNVRQQLFAKIIGATEHVCIFKINTNEVDEYVFSNTLNKLEAKAMAGIIDNIFASRVFVDACDINPMRYKKWLECKLGSIPRPKIFSLHHADRSNTAVSAASIIAKVIRDEEIHKIRSRYNEIGSGYPSDKRTMKFISGWIADYDSAPDFARRSWRPVKNILDGYRRIARNKDLTE